MFEEGLTELEKISNYIRQFGIPEENFKIDLKIARGLDYYTGTVYETFFDEYRNLGSVCSGGRYDNLTEYYTERKFQGVGVSIGLTRLYDQLKELGLIKESKNYVAKVLVVPMDENVAEFALKTAKILRDNDVSTEVYSNFSKDMKSKLKYADRLNIPYVCIIGEDEIKENCVMLKNMNEKTQEKLKINEAINLING
jgi:histidyl-tRNA synthetase